MGTSVRDAAAAGLQAWASSPPPDTSCEPDFRPRVLVLLATYNGERWIHQQLESILAQTGVDVRIAIRDDNSSDGTLEEIARCQPDARIHLCVAAVRSGSAAQNFLELMRENPAEGFDFVAFSDQDDLWHAGKLQRACRRLAQTACSGYSSATLASWPDGRRRLLRQAARPTRGDFLFEGAGQGCTFVLPADFYAKARGFIAQHAHLTRTLHYHDWMLYALARGWRRSWTFDPWPSVAYRQHCDNDTGARGSWSSVRKRLKLMSSRWYSTQIRAVAALCAAAAPDNRVVKQWNSVLAERRPGLRRARMVLFCLRAGRRKQLDNAALTLAALAGWI